MSLPHNIITEQCLKDSGYVEEKGVWVKGEVTMQRWRGKWQLTCPKSDGDIYIILNIGTRHRFERAMEFCVDAEVEMLKFPPTKTIEEYYKELGPIDSNNLRTEGE